MLSAKFSVWPRVTMTALCSLASLERSQEASMENQSISVASWKVTQLQPAGSKNCRISDPSGA